MHIYFSGIGGTGIGPLALVAKQAGYAVSGSDKQMSNYIEYLQGQGITEIHIGQSADEIRAIDQKHKIDWFVYSSALPMENPNHPELKYCEENGIRTSKRDELLNKILEDKKQKLIAIAGTHGKTTTTALTVWLMQQAGIPISYILPAKTSFAQMGAYDDASEYFVYEADEFDRNFLAFAPELSVITGVDWDHPDIYPTRESYNEAFKEFLSQSKQSVMWQVDVDRLGLGTTDGITVLEAAHPDITLPGEVNRQNAWEAVIAVNKLSGTDTDKLIKSVNEFPGVSRRFEQIAPGLFSDYAHTAPKIRGALQLGHEVAGDKLVVVYEGLHNTRQHFMKDDLVHLFDDVKHLFIVPSYLAREDTSLEFWKPADLQAIMSEKTRTHTTPMELNTQLHHAIYEYLLEGNIVLCLTAGGGGSLDEWLRQSFAQYRQA
jgi:UDP-N-acetylmuramate--alanine ligase